MGKLVSAQQQSLATSLGYTLLPEIARQLFSRILRATHIVPKGKTSMSLVLNPAISVLLALTLTGCVKSRLNPCAQYLLSAKSPVLQSIPLVRGDATQRPPWQPQPGEGLVGAANGKDPDQALLQFQKEPGGSSLRYLNPTRIYHYRCSVSELNKHN